MQDSIITDALASLQDLAPAGFAIALHIRFTAPTLLFQTYPKPWTDYYSQNGLVMSDPTVAWGFGNTGAVHWSTLTHRDSSGVLEKAADFGLRFGVTCATAHADSRSMAGFTRADRAFRDADVSQLQTHFQRLHEQTTAETTLSPVVLEKLDQMHVRLIKSA